jgi:4-oxalomesaconate tautomerase
LIPHNCHKAIGGVGAVVIATACLVPPNETTDLAVVPASNEKSLSIEHPTGEMTVVARVKNGEVASAGVLRTARKLFDGVVFPKLEDQ